MTIAQIHKAFQPLNQEIKKTDKRFAAKIKRLVKKNGWNPEYNHEDADEIIVELLKNHGYTRTAKAFEKLEKWYS